MAVVLGQVYFSDLQILTFDILRMFWHCSNYLAIWGRFSAIKKSKVVATCLSLGNDVIVACCLPQWKQFWTLYAITYYHYQL